MSLPPWRVQRAAAALVRYGRRWRAAREPGLLALAEAFGWLHDPVAPAPPRPRWRPAADFQ